MRIITQKEKGVGLEKDNFQGILVIEEMTAAQATVDQGQYQEQLQIGIELSVISVENMIISQMIAYI